MFKAILGRVLGRPRLPEKLSYEQARAALERQSRELSRELASRPGVEPEILYYLAENADPEIRARVARNTGAPPHANRLLCDDTDEEVRAALARKIGRLIPGLHKEQNERLRDMVIETLERLGADQAPRVRAVVAEQIKLTRNAPRDLIKRLARDTELQVSAPILEYSPLLSDADLMEIVALTEVTQALQAVARRRNLSPAVCDAVIATLDIPATAALIANPAANISKPAMETILQRAAEIEAWHEPLTRRPNLSVRVVRRIAGFVSSALIERLADRDGLEPDVAAELKRSARRAIDGGALDEKPEPDAAAALVAEAQRTGGLDDGFVSRAAERGDRDVVILSLAKLCAAPTATIRRILDSLSARAVTALVWRAGLHMRCAVAVQSGILKLPYGEILPARGGTDFPMAPDEMETHLTLFGLQPQGE